MTDVEITRENAIARYSKRDTRSYRALIVTCSIRPVNRLSRAR